MVAVLDGEGLLGNRPFVRSAERPQTREADFRAQARSEDRPIQDVRAEWAAENIGTTPARETYQEWLGRQPADFQDEVLGPTRGKLFREGEVTLDQLVDRRGNELTLEQLGTR